MREREREERRLGPRYGFPVMRSYSVPFDEAGLQGRNQDTFFHTGVQLQEQSYKH